MRKSEGILFGKYNVTINRNDSDCTARKEDISSWEKAATTQGEKKRPLLVPAGEVLVWKNPFIDKWKE